LQCCSTGRVHQGRRCCWKIAANIMVLYELVWMIAQRTRPADMKELVQRTAATVLGRGGVIKQIVSHGHTELAYSFKTKGERHPSARHFTLDVECSPSTLAEVHNILRINPNVLRYVALKQTPFPKEDNTLRKRQLAAQREWEKVVEAERAKSLQ